MILIIKKIFMNNLVNLFNILYIFNKILYKKVLLFQCNLVMNLMYLFHKKKFKLNQLVHNHLIMKVLIQNLSLRQNYQKLLKKKYKKKE
jgi:hypothetical protein